MENTKLTATQQEAIEIIKRLIKEEKIDFNDAFKLFISVYEKEKEYVYVPYSSPWYPWYTEPYRTEPYKIWCNSPDSTNASSINSDDVKSGETYATNANASSKQNSLGSLFDVLIGTDWENMWNKSSTV